MNHDYFSFLNLDTIFSKLNHFEGADSQRGRLTKLLHIHTIGFIEEAGCNINYYFGYLMTPN